MSESWAVPSDTQELLDGYAGWNPALLEMLSEVKEPLKWGIHDRDPLERWVSGQVVLMGDAAHPIMPTLAQGAALAMEDGFALARILADHSADIDGALAQFETERVPRAKRAVLQARAQFQSNQQTPAPPPLDRGWIFAHDVTLPPRADAAETPEFRG